jgi:hypothetical protein
MDRWTGSQNPQRVVMPMEEGGQVQINTPGHNEFECVWVCTYLECESFLSD